MTKDEIARIIMKVDEQLPEKEVIYILKDSGDGVYVVTSRGIFPPYHTPFIATYDGKITGFLNMDDARQYIKYEHSPIVYENEVIKEGRKEFYGEK